ncbi:MAG: glycosyltransferase, partial [Candidatus Omnitrophota bacterium]
RSFGRILDDSAPEIVHIQSLLYLSSGIVAEAKQRGIPVLFTLNDYWLMCPQGQRFRNDQTVCRDAGPRECACCVGYQLGIRKNVSLAYSFIRRYFPECFLPIVKNMYMAAASRIFLNNAKRREFISDRRAHMNRICSDIDCFIAPSHFIKRAFLEFGIPGDKITRMSYGFDRAKFEGLTKTASPVVRFGFIGNIMPSKGLHVLIESFKGIPGDRACLKIYGAAYSYKSALGGYARMVKSLAGRGNIAFMGPFDNSRIREVFENIDVLVVPSIWQENSPLVIQEAFLSRTSVIASRTGGIPELITDGVDGFLVEAGNAGDLRRSIINMISLPGILTRELRSVPKVKSIEENAAELEALYSQLIGRSRK